MSYIYLNEDEIDVELKCIICNEPFQSPVNCIKCGQTFCEQCINTWRKQQSSCPSCREYGYTFTPVITRILTNQLNRLLGQCSLCQQTNIQRINFSDHILYTCPKQIISCTNDKCKWKGCRENHEQHLFQRQRKRSKLSRLLRFFSYFACTSKSFNVIFRSIDIFR
jgi:hypothetical protein